MTDGTTRDYIDLHIKHLREYLETRIGQLREVVDTRLRKDDEALRLWTTEIHRRLDNLNHEQARLAADRERYLPRETFEEWRSADAERNEEVSKILSGHRGEERGVGLAWVVGAMVVTWLIALVAIFWR